jgi:hypothetical protein
LGCPVISFRVFASVIPLIAVMGFAGSWAKPAAQPCISTPSGSLSFSSLPWRADIHVGFTENSADATVRVLRVEEPDLADFVVTDDGLANMSDPAETDACQAASSRVVTIDSHAPSGSAIIYLSGEPNPGERADYRIFVQSTAMSAREAAAMIVAAGGRPANASTEQPHAVVKTLLTMN